MKTHELSEAVQRHEQEPEADGVISAPKRLSAGATRRTGRRRRTTRDEQTDDDAAPAGRVVGGDDSASRAAPATTAANATPQRAAEAGHRSSCSRSPDSSALGTKPRAPERVTSGPKSDESRLETRISVGQRRGR